MSVGSRLCALVAGLTLVAGLAFAQAPNPTPTPTAPLESVPGKNLSEKLNRSNGVIHPKEVDPAIESRRRLQGTRTYCRRTRCRRQGLQATLPRRSRNEENGGPRRRVHPWRSKPSMPFKFGQTTLDKLADFARPF
jgi:hypothetical protein